MGSLRQHSASKEIEYDLLEDSDVSTLIRKIIDLYPSLAGVLDGTGNLVMVGGIEVGNLNGRETKLSDSAEVVFVPVTHGG